MFSKSSHLLQYRVEIHDQYYRKGHSDQSKVHRLALLEEDLTMVNNKIWNNGQPSAISADLAARGAITAIRILNLCNKNARQAFMCDGEADPADAHALVIQGNGLSKVIREFTLTGDVKHLRTIVALAMEMLAVYVRQCWARDVDLNQVIATQLEEESVEDIFHPFHQVEINRLISAATATLSL